MLTQESGKDVLMYHLTEESFDIEVLREKGAVVVMFYERWCPKCSMTKPIVEELEKKYRGRIKFCEVEVAENPRLAAACGADIVPAFLFVKGGAVEASMKGTTRENTGKKAEGIALRGSSFLFSSSIFKKSFVYNPAGMCYIEYGKD